MCTLPRGQEEKCGRKGETPVSGRMYNWEPGHRQTEPLLDSWGLKLSPPQLPPFRS